MARNANNKILQKAKKSKSDEFYTQYIDIVDELQYYKKHFEGKTVYCNCDDPYVSNFFKYFAQNFHSLRLKKLISSCYRESTQDLFTANTNEDGFFCEYTGEIDARQNPKIRTAYFNGDGDFRSAECVKLLKQSDIVVTNPPFSLFRDFISQVIQYEKKFLVIANINALTYKEIFHLIQQNKVWLGINFGRGISGFIVPEHYSLYGTEARINSNGERIVSTNNCLWVTNLELDERYKDLPLTKEYAGNENEYPKFDNCDAINVNKTQDIPKDYRGIIGVPITFLHKYNPNQFELIRFRKGDDGKDLSVNGHCPYFRILIQNKTLLSTKI